MYRSANAPFRAYNRGTYGSDKSNFNAGMFERTSPAPSECVRVLEMSVAHLKTLFQSRATHMTALEREKQKQEAQPIANADHTSATMGIANTSSTATSISDKLTSVNEMINHVIHFMVSNLEAQLVPPAEPWQKRTGRTQRMEKDNEVANGAEHGDDLLDPELKPSFLHSAIPLLVPLTKAPPSVADSPMQKGSEFASAFPHLMPPLPLDESIPLSDPSPLPISSSFQSNMLTPIESLLDLDKLVAREVNIEEEEIKNKGLIERQQRRASAVVNRSSRHTSDSDNTNPSSPSSQSATNGKQLTLNTSSPSLTIVPPSPSPSATSLQSSHLFHLSHARLHFSRLFSTALHPYGITVIDFLDQMRDPNLSKWNQLRSDASHSWTAICVNDQQVSQQPSRSLHVRSVLYSHLHRYLTSLRTFQACHFRLILSTYPYLTHTHALKQLTQNILKRILFDALSPTIQSYYSGVYASEDSWLVRHIKSVVRDRKKHGDRNVSMKDFGIDASVWGLEEAGSGAQSSESKNHLDVPTTTFNGNGSTRGDELPAYPLLSSSFPFSSTLSVLDYLFTTPVLHVKIDLLPVVCRELSDEYNQHMAAKGNSNNNDINPNAGGAPVAAVATASNSSTDAKHPVLSTLSHFTPFSMFQFQSNSNTQSASVNSSGASKESKSSKDATVATNFLCSDELIPLMAYALFHLSPACQSNLFSDLRMMEENLAENEAIGDKGFCLTLLCSAVQVIVDLQVLHTAVSPSSSDSPQAAIAADNSASNSSDS